MKPRRPTIKDSSHNVRSEGAKRKAQQVAAKAARKAAAKKAKAEAEMAALPEGRGVTLDFRGTMHSLQLHPGKTALVLIDLQKGIVSTPTVPHSAAEVVQNSNLMARTFREKGGTVVYVRVDMANVLQLPADQPPRDPNAPAPPASASELVPEAGFDSGAGSKDLLITKRHWGAFAGTNLEQALRERGVDTVVLAGIATNIGVESTARQGTGLGFAFVIVEDACSARDAEAHRFSFEKIFPRLARVRSTEEVIAALG